jgi:drug/metabolite transporter (DMT)-like permease
MEIVLALCAASIYGVADYCGGRASRTVTPVVVTFVGQCAGFLFLLTIAVTSGADIPPLSDWIWGGVAGGVGATGLLAFYRAMGSGYMTVVAPVSAVTATAIPVIVGLATGERPGVLALLGIPIAVVAIALVSDVMGPDHRKAPRIVLWLAIVAGSGFGTIFVILGHTTDGSGMWPVVAMRLVSIPLMFIVLRAQKLKIGSARVSLRIVLASGILDSAANGIYLLAVRQGLMSIVSTINSFYPASTLLLATKLDGERIHRSQAVGLLCAAISLTLISIS